MIKNTPQENKSLSHHHYYRTETLSLYFELKILRDENAAGRQFLKNTASWALQEHKVESTPECLHKRLLISVPGKLTGAFH